MQKKWEHNNERLTRKHLLCPAWGWCVRNKL